MSFEEYMYLVTRGFELLGVAVIVVGLVVATYQSLILGMRHQPVMAYQVFRATFGRAVLMGLEVLVAGDIIRTVAVDPTLENLLVLGLLVIIRTFLSWSLEVEIDGRWPWQAAKAAEKPSAE